jgi:hypothetical protein
VASSLFEEGAITVIYIVLMNCKSMLERLSNSYGENLMLLCNYAVCSLSRLRFICYFRAKPIFSLILPSDYLVDEGAELSSTTELLLDRTHEQALVDLMTPSLVLLINLLQILHVICSVLFLVWFKLAISSGCSYQ